MHQRQTTLCILASLDVLALVQRQAVRQPACLALCQNRLKKDGFVYLSLAQEELFESYRYLTQDYCPANTGVEDVYYADGWYYINEVSFAETLTKGYLPKGQMEAAIPSLIPMMLQQA